MSPSLHNSDIQGIEDGGEGESKIPEPSEFVARREELKKSFHRTTGPWTTLEIKQLLTAFKAHGRDWLCVAAKVKSRTNDQVSGVLTSGMILSTLSRCFPGSCSVVKKLIHLNHIMV